MFENFSFSDDSSQISEDSSDHYEKTKYPKPKHPRAYLIVEDAAHVIQNNRN